MGSSSPFTDEFDAVFSHAALHWMRDQEAVLASVHRPLKRGGRFIAEMGGHNPWYFASADAYRRKLESAGFWVEEIAILRRPRVLPTGLEAWLDTFAEDFLGAVMEADRSRARSEVIDSAAAGLDGRNRHLDHRLRAAAFPRDPGLVR